MMKNNDVENRRADEHGQSAPGIASGDEEDAKRVKEQTTTRERAAVSKRAHEPLHLEDAEDEQPVEHDNGPRLAEVAGPEAAKVADPAQPTQTEDGLTNEKTKVTRKK